MGFEPATAWTTRAWRRSRAQTIRSSSRANSISKCSAPSASARTRMAAQRVPLRILQEMMRHQDFKTTLLYADYAPSER
jgi:hypothetical protein